MSARQVVQVFDGDTSSCPPPRVPAIGPSRPPVHHWCSLGPDPGGQSRQKQFHGWAAECVSHKSFSRARRDATRLSRRSRWRSFIHICLFWGEHVTAEHWLCLLSVKTFKSISNLSKSMLWHGQRFLLNFIFLESSRKACLERGKGCSRRRRWGGDASHRCCTKPVIRGAGRLAAPTKSKRFPWHSEKILQSFRKDFFDGQSQWSELRDKQAMPGICQ